MGEKDITEKILLSYADVFADIVNALLFQGEHIVKPDELIDQVPRAIYKADGRTREVERDVAKRWLKNNIRIACIGFENETEPDPDMPLRVFNYDGAEYRTQLLRENKNSPRYPVVTIVLYFGYKKRWDAPKSVHEVLDIAERLKPFVPDLKINLFEIAYLTDEQLGYFHSDFRIVADYFAQKQRSGDYIPSREKLLHVESVLQLLSVMSNDTRFEEVLNQEDGSDQGGVSNMCEVLDRVEARGRAAGEIIGAIKLYRDELNLMPTEIIKKIMVRFGLDRAVAEKYVEETLGLQLA